MSYYRFCQDVDTIYHLWNGVPASWSHFLNSNGQKQKLSAISIYMFIGMQLKNVNRKGSPERRWLSQLSAKGSSLTESGDRGDRSDWRNIGQVEVRVGLITFSLRKSPPAPRYQNLEEWLLLTKKSEEETCLEQFDIIRVKVCEGRWVQFVPPCKNQLLRGCYCSCLVAHLFFFACLASNTGR